jgi:predicted nicotinamide N-methyase
VSRLGNSALLDGDALVLALTRRFRTSIEDATIDTRIFSILKPANPDDLIREEDFVMDERLPYWADVWPSSIILAGEAARTFRVWAQRTRAWVGWAEQLAATSADSMCCRRIITRTRSMSRERMCFAIWHPCAHATVGRLEALPEDLGTFDLVFASDVLYEKEYAELLPTSASAAGSRGVALDRDPGRVAAPVFVEACASTGSDIRKKKPGRSRPGRSSRRSISTRSRREVDSRAD